MPDWQTCSDAATAAAAGVVQTFRGGKLQNSGPAVEPDGNSKEDVEEPENAVVGLASMWIHGSQMSLR
jgi:hypothetical protein